MLPKGCADNTTSCIDSRGNVFDPNASSTWQNQGIYDLADHISDLLGFVGVSHRIDVNVTYSVLNVFSEVNTALIQ